MSNRVKGLAEKLAKETEPSERDLKIMEAVYSIWPDAADGANIEILSTRVHIQCRIAFPYGRLIFRVMVKRALPHHYWISDIKITDREYEMNADNLKSLILVRVKNAIMIVLDNEMEEVLGKS